MSAFAKFMHDGVEVALLDGLHDVVSDPCGAHLRLQIVRGHFRRRHEDALFAAERFFDAAVEEIRHVGVFFGFPRNGDFFRLCSAKTCARICGDLFGSKHIAQPRPGLSYCVIATKQRFFGLFASANSLNPGSAMARVIWRARSREN